MTFSSVSVSSVSSVCVYVQVWVVTQWTVPCISSGLSSDLSSDLSSQPTYIYRKSFSNICIYFFCLEMKLEKCRLIEKKLLSCQAGASNQHMTPPKGFDHHKRNSQTEENTKINSMKLRKPDKTSYPEPAFVFCTQPITVLSVCVCQCVLPGVSPASHSHPHSRPVHDHAAAAHSSRGLLLPLSCDREASTPCCLYSQVMHPSPTASSGKRWRLGEK